MTKFVDDAGLAYFKGKIDDNFLDKKKGGAVEKNVDFKSTIAVTGISGYSSNPLLVPAGFKINDVTGISAAATQQAVGSDTTNRVWNDKGGRIVVGAANGLATLDANGKIPLSQLGNIDTTFVEAVDKLPETNIGKHLYLVVDKAASDVNQNKYAEYVYTGTLPINDTNKYDAAKWEKLGDFQADVDLTDYSKKNATISSIKSAPASGEVNLSLIYGDDDETDLTLEAATTTKAGVMTAADKNILTKLANRYPFDINSFGANPSVAELNKPTVVNLSWGYQNEDFHTVSSQSVKGTHGISGDATVAIGTKTYSTVEMTLPTGANKVTATFTLTSKADANATTKTRTCSTVFVHAGYCGVVAADKTALTANEIIALGNKAVINGKNRTVSISQTNQKLVYAYPAYFGDLTSIKDGNGFQGFSGYTKLAAVTVNGTSYNVYMQNTPATATGSYTFA